MREIKFRFWDSRTNSWCDSENWLPSTVRFGVNETFAFANKDGIIAQQYTGIKDKNGTEVYEGDIVEHNHKNLKKPIRQTIKFECVQADDYLDLDSYGYHIRDVLNVIERAVSGRNDNFEVIGNIFEGVDK